MRTLTGASAAGVLALLFAVLAPGGVAAAQLEDPEWPCIQRKVPELSLGQMWSGPEPEAGWREDRAIAELAQRIAPRRVPQEEVVATVSAWSATLTPEERPGKLAGLFAAVLHRINAERGQVIGGIARYSHRQIDMAERIADRESALAELAKVPEAERDMDRFEEMQDELAWDTRVYRERQQSLTYVCETPVLLEQRAFAIGRALAGLI